MSRTDDLNRPDGRDRNDRDAEVDHFWEALTGTEMLAADMVDWEEVTGNPGDEESLENTAFDVDRMVNEGLGGGQVTEDNGYIGDSTTDALFNEDELDITNTKGES